MQPYCTSSLLSAKFVDLTMLQRQVPAKYRVVSCVARFIECVKQPWPDPVAVQCDLLLLYLRW